MEVKKAQAWGFDLTVGFVIFTIAVISFYFFAVNYPSDSEEVSEEMLYEGQLIGESLLSEGSPANWDAGNVVQIGLTTDGKINATKLDNFLTLDYETTKTLFNVRHDYLVNFSSPVDKTFGEVDFNADNLVKVVRVSSYEGQPITLSIYLSD